MCSLPENREERMPYGSVPGKGVTGEAPSIAIPPGSGRHGSGECAWAAANKSGVIRSKPKKITANGYNGSNGHYI